MPTSKRTTSEPVAKSWCRGPSPTAPHRTVSAWLRAAGRSGHLGCNPMRQVRVPSAPPPEAVPLSADEARTVLAAARGWHYAARWSVALALGLRQGERRSGCAGTTWTSTGGGSPCAHRSPVPRESPAQRRSTMTLTDFLVRISPAPPIPSLTPGVDGHVVGAVVRGLPCENTIVVPGLRALTRHSLG